MGDKAKFRIELEYGGHHFVVSEVAPEYFSNEKFSQVHILSIRENHQLNIIHIRMIIRWYSTYYQVYSTVYVMRGEEGDLHVRIHYYVQSHGVYYYYKQLFNHAVAWLVKLPPSLSAITAISYLYELVHFQRARKNVELLYLTVAMTSVTDQSDKWEKWVGSSYCPDKNVILDPTKCPYNTIYYVIIWWYYDIYVIAVVSTWFCHNFHCPWYYSYL